MNSTPREIVMNGMAQSRELNQHSRDWVTLNRNDLQDMLRDAVQQGFQLGKETAERNATRRKKLISKRHDKDFDAGKVYRTRDEDL